MINLLTRYSVNLSDKYVRLTKMTAAQPIDMVHLSHYTMGSEELEQEVLRLFYSQIQNLIDNLKETTDPKERYELLHTIKGSARGVGAWDIEKSAQNGEKLVNFGTDEEFNEQLIELEDHITSARSFIEAQLA